MKSFPHLKDTNFPNVSNVNVYEYQNDFDYSKFANTQMHIKLMSVPWDLGEVHVGLRSVPMGNVVHFESEKERDSWLDSQPGTIWETRYRAYHAEDEIKLPMPFEQIALYNYIVIDYEESPVSIPGKKSIKRWLYFIRDVRMESLNSTVCTIKRDSWQMFINDIDVSYLQLERGHAPMFAAAKPEDYLKAPIKNTAGLLAEDSNFGAATLSSNVSCWVPNESEQYLVFCCYANVNTGDWGKKSDNTWCVPREIYKTHNGVPSSHVFAISTDDVGTFLTNMDNDIPQFAQCVEACFTVAKYLVSVGDSFTFCGVKCYPANGRTTLEEISLPTVDQFGYSEKVKNVTKLYTAPYSHLEITDENGTITQVNIEDCSGDTLQIRSSLSLAFPWLRLDAQINGVGSKESKHLTFKNLEDHTFRFSGRWADLVRQWEIPCYVIQQGNNKTNDYRTHYDRLSDKEQTDNTAETDKDNTYASANVLVTNTKTQTAANATMTARSNTGASKDTSLSNALNTALNAWQVGYTKETKNIDSDAAIQSAAISVASGVIGNAASGVAMGATVGSVVPGAGTAAGAVLGGVAGALSGVASGVVTAANTAVTVNANSAQVDASIKLSDASLEATNNNNVDRVNNQNNVNSDNTATQNKASNAIAAASAQTMKNNADRTCSMLETNVRTRNSRQQDQAHVLAPNKFGRETANDNVTRPNGLWLNVCTQTEDAINQAASEFLRYGYRYNQQWEFETWDVGKRFTYWKASDIWLLAKELPDAFVDEIRNYLLQGVTIWRKPEYINNTSIYENGI